MYLPQVFYTASFATCRAFSVSSTSPFKSEETQSQKRNPHQEQGLHRQRGASERQTTLCQPAFSDPHSADSHRAPSVLRPPGTLGTRRPTAARSSAREAPPTVRQGPGLPRGGRSLLQRDPPSTGRLPTACGASPRRLPRGRARRGGLRPEARPSPAPSQSRAPRRPESPRCAGRRPGAGPGIPPRHRGRRAARPAGPGRARAAGSGGAVLTWAAAPPLGPLQGQVAVGPQDEPQPEQEQRAERQRQEQQRAAHGAARGRSGAAGARRRETRRSGRRRRRRRSALSWGPQGCRAPRQGRRKRRVCAGRAPSGDGCHPRGGGDGAVTAPGDEVSRLSGPWKTSGRGFEGKYFRRLCSCWGRNEHSGFEQDPALPPVPHCCRGN